MNDHDDISRSARARVIVKGMARAIVKGLARSVVKDVADAVTDAVGNLAWADWVQDLVSLWIGG